jgi:hypothetical protein
MLLLVRVSEILAGRSHSRVLLPMIWCMDQSTAEFLRVEYDTAWAHIRGIDDRRLKFVEFYISLNTILATVIATVVTRSRGSMFTFGNFVLVLIGGIIVVGSGITILGMLRSERAANLRFRRRVNYIREIFLEGSKDDRIREYLNRHAELNTPTSKTESLHAWGSTLAGVRRLIFGGFLAWGAATLAMLLLAAVVGNS